MAARQYSVDLSGYSSTDIANAIAYHRRNYSTWPTEPLIREAITKIERPQKALPAQTGRASIPGMSRLFRKFRRERRPYEDFAAAQKRLNAEYESYKRQGWRWPDCTDEIDRLLDELFGKREATGSVLPSFEAVI